MTENDERVKEAHYTTLLYDRLQTMLANDIAHARICPQHVKNIDPWVRESDYLLMKSRAESAESRISKALSIVGQEISFGYDVNSDHLARRIVWALNPEVVEKAK